VQGINRPTDQRPTNIFHGLRWSDSLPRLVMMVAAAGRRIVVISVLMAAVPAPVLPIVGR
jgi:hypothetical protein